MAVREGFEPSMQLQTTYSLSRGAPSATRPPHQIHYSLSLLHHEENKENGASWRIRTSDRLVRSQVLYPAELRTRIILLCLLANSNEQEMAVREGFEPSMQLQTTYSLSRGAPSASRPPHRLAEAHITIYQKYVKHFIRKNWGKSLNRCVFNQSDCKLNFPTEIHRYSRVFFYQMKRSISLIRITLLLNK